MKRLNKSFLVLLASREVERDFHCFNRKNCFLNSFDFQVKRHKFISLSNSSLSCFFLSTHISISFFISPIYLCFFLSPSLSISEFVFVLNCYLWFLNLSFSLPLFSFLSFSYFRFPFFFLSFLLTAYFSIIKYFLSNETKRRHRNKTKRFS